MIGKTFFRYGEVVALAGSEDIVTELVAQQRLSVFLKFSHQQALPASPLAWADDEEPPFDEPDPHCTVRQAVVEGDFDGFEFRPAKGFELSGWFAVEPGASKAAAFAESFALPLLVSRPKDADRFIEGACFRILAGCEASLSDAWFRRTQVEEVFGEQPRESDRWPWGEHTTELLELLSETAKRYWGENYDPADEKTVTQARIVKQWLMDERGVSGNAADSIDLILRPKNLKKGPR